jgi:carbon monoxide dehydrogenase subunit G
LAVVPAKSVGSVRRVPDHVRKAATREGGEAGALGGKGDMAMTMTGEVALPATRQTVWAKLNDPAVLKACIPGCEELTQDDPTHFSATAKVKIGPVKATFRGKVGLSDLDPPNGYRINGEGEGGVAGYAKGGAKVMLSDAPEGGTLLSYDVEAQVGGKIMQLGARLINSVAKKYADEFFANFARAVADESPVA